jgi:hypothetical protein
MIGDRSVWCGNGRLQKAAPTTPRGNVGAPTFLGIGIVLADLKVGHYMGCGCEFAGGSRAAAERFVGGVEFGRKREQSSRTPKG